MFDLTLTYFSGSGREGPNVAMPPMGHSPPSPRVICKQIRERRVNRNIEASAKFFRSKMSYPLSPKTPAVLVDIIIKKDDYHTERAVHVSIYDMTHRFEYESSWIDRVTNAFASKHAEDSATNDAIKTREESTLTNVRPNQVKLKPFKLLFCSNHLHSRHLCYEVICDSVGL